MTARPFRLYLIWCLLVLIGAGWADHHGVTLFADDTVERGASGGVGGIAGRRGPVHK